MSAPRFSSQHAEDKWIIDNLNPVPGFFLDIGAFNGVTCSNTLAFEDLGWHGICVEPDPVMAAQCALARKCQTLCAAIGIRSANPSAFFINPQDRGLSSLDWKKRNCTPEEKSILVPVLTLEALVLCCPKFQCDLLSIDTEGTELEVWHSGRGYHPRIVLIEYQTADEPSQELPIIHRLTQEGYGLLHRTPHNLIFAR